MKAKTFEETLKLFEYKTDLRTAFDDFLTLTICAFGQNPTTDKSYDEDLYMQTIAKYRDDKLRFEFPTLLACLSNEMEARFKSDTGWDVLGEYYEQHFYRKGLQQYFTPWDICSFMARCSIEKASSTVKDRPLRILEPSCGSGRMLLAAFSVAGPYNEYYGIDLDATCVKMTALNLFLSGMFRSETMKGNFLVPEDFHESYKTSFLPFGLFRVKEKDKSRLWHLMQLSSKTPKKNPSPPDLNGSQHNAGSQLTIF